MDGQNDGMLIDRAEEARKQEITEQYLNFLDNQTDTHHYRQKIMKMMNDGESRLVMNLDEIREVMPERAEGLLTQSVLEMNCLQTALQTAISNSDVQAVVKTGFHVGFEGTFGERHVNPRTLKSSYLGNLVCCEGIVTKCSSVRQKLLTSVHYCPATNKVLEKKFADFTMLDSIVTNNAYPTEDENKNPLETEFGHSVYKDHQTFTIQELPESAPAGQLPRAVDCVADLDLADRVKPGDRVRIIGIFRVLPNKQNGVSSGSFRSIIIINHIQMLSKEIIPNFEPQDVKDVRKISKSKDPFELLARSLAPSICGHEETKKALLCLLLGGMEKVLENGSRLRGDINVLLIGDPSVAKSQLLRYVLRMAPRAITTTGRGSSGVGLTAAVTTDPDSGERRLEAGAMVLADRGVVCIDEFDKMSDIDRTAIHEVMEQGRVTISKAGIHAKLNARCSVLAAANPVYGRYNPFKSPMENIGMQDSLLSRFDLIFVLLDEHDADRDANVAGHVLKLHTYRTQGESDGNVLPMGGGVETISTISMETKKASTSIYEENTQWAGIQNTKILTMDFMRKYIHLARAVQPVLTDEATEYISEVYADIRSFDITKTDQERTMPVTARQLETLIRLSSAIAKARFSKKVEREDTEKAYNLLHFACFKEKPKARQEYEKKKRGAQYEGEDEEEQSDDEPEDTQTHDEPGSSSVPTAATPRRGVRRRAADDNDTQSTVNDTTISESQPTAKKARTGPAAIGIDRYKELRKYVREAFDKIGTTDDMVELQVITDSVQTLAGRNKFTDDELKAGYEQLENDNAAMVVEGKITLI
uniref:DNA replication licensing factor MCM3 n=1 Tax=Caenorhabditis tropicalis TaxID=1561998 RepID=A0A1I7U881_9PELO